VITRVCLKTEPEIEREVTILAMVHDALAWMNITESAGENRKRLCSRTLIYPAEAEGLTRVISAQDVRADSREGLWDDYMRIFHDLAGYSEDLQPRLIPYDSVYEIAVA
jgi:hypothetical protein